MMFTSKYYVCRYYATNQLIKYMKKMFRQYRKSTPFVGYFASRIPAVLLIDAELIKDVLISKFKQFHDNEFASMVNTILIRLCV